MNTQVDPDPGAVQEGHVPTRVWPHHVQVGGEFWPNRFKDGIHGIYPWMFYPEQRFPRWTHGGLSTGFLTSVSFSAEQCRAFQLHRPTMT